MMNPHPLRFLVIEYLPHVMHNEKARPARIDGHYQHRHHAEEVAELWAEKPLHPESRIVVAEVQIEAKAPAHWIERASA
jgi:hypothetical protein